MRRDSFTSRMVGIAALVLALGLLVGCGTPTSTTTSTHVAQGTPTATPLPTGLPTAQANAKCQFPGAGDTAQVVQLSDGLQVTVPVAALDYPSEELPAGTPNAPYNVPSGIFNGQYHPNPRVNPSLGDGSGYSIEICNPTATTHQVTAMSVMITLSTPLTGPINTFNLCNPVYDASQKQLMGGGCGGAFIADEYLLAQFTSDTVGANVNATLSTTVTSPGGAFPFNIGSGKTLVIDMGIGGLTQDGTYQLLFSVTADGAAPAYIATSATPFLIAQHAVEWTGQNCQQSASQIPSASQPTYYICPPA